MSNKLKGVIFVGAGSMSVVILGLGIVSPKNLNFKSMSTLGCIGCILGSYVANYGPLIKLSLLSLT